jgi:acyl transferase domain-containing protein
MPWPSGPRRRLAGVSSFGFSGTNAHLILEEAPARAESALLSRPWHCLVVSGKTRTALASGARRLAAHLRANPDLPLADVAWSANSGRARLAERIAVVAANSAEAAAALSRVADGEGGPTSFTGRAVPGDGPELVFLFPGQGAQYGGMARQLFETEPVVRATLERCDAILGRELDRSLLDIIFDPDERTLESMAYAQPALFAVEYALAELWRSWGVKPAAVLGHSAGELVAACVAGVMGVEEGLRLIATRETDARAAPAG